MMQLMKKAGVRIVLAHADLISEQSGQLHQIYCHSQSLSESQFEVTRIFNVNYIIVYTVCFLTYD